MQRKLVFRFDTDTSTAEYSNWIVSRNRFPEGMGNAVTWPAPASELYHSFPEEQGTEFVLTWHDREEDKWEYAFLEFHVGDPVGTCWAQDYRLDRVIEKMCKHMKLPAGRLALSNFLFDWLFYPKTHAQVLSEFEGGKRK